MKKVMPACFVAPILFFILIVAPVISPAQVTKVRDTVYISSGEIKKLIDDKYYVRVPSSDLEQRLQEKVTAVVTDKFNFIYGLIGVVSFLIGSILLFNLRSVVGSRIDRELKETHIPLLNTKISDNINDIKSNIKENFSDLDKEMDLKIENYFLKNLRKNIDEALGELKKEQQKALLAQEEFSRKNIEILKVFSETRFEKLKTNVDNQRDLQKTMDNFKDLLNQADISNDLEMISKVLNELSYVCFYLKKDTEFERLLDNYSNRTDIEIKETTFVNAALGTFIDYKNTGETLPREKTLRYLNKALRKTGDYGEAMAIKLELFVVDYDFAVDSVKKNRPKQKSSK
jgi:hypothetical protein